MKDSASERTERLVAMGQMAASMAHEIRNPLGGMELFCSLLVKELSGDDRKRHLAEQILKGIRTVDRIIQNCLQFAREIVPQRTDVRNLQEYCSDIASLVAARAKDLGVVISIDAPVDQGYFDPFLVQQTLVNLLSNGIDAVHERSRRELKEQLPESEKRVSLSILSVTPLVFCVEDNGDGIPEENLQKIFDPFMTTKTTGTGLGLAICHAIARAHGGEIRVEVIRQKDDRDGIISGTRFILEIGDLERNTQVERKEVLEQGV